MKSGTRGLLLNATLGWGWADPIAGLVIAVAAIREGLEAWRGEGCGPPGGQRGGEAATSGGCGCTGDGCCDTCCPDDPAEPQTV